MSVARIAPRPITNGASESTDDALKRANWRQAHEVRALRDMLTICRRCAAALADENAMLHEQLADLTAGAVRGDAKAGARTRGHCRV